MTSLVMPTNGNVAMVTPTNENAAVRTDNNNCYQFGADW